MSFLIRWWFLVPEKLYTEGQLYPLMKPRPRRWKCRCRVKPWAPRQLPGVNKHHLGLRQGHTCAVLFQPVLSSCEPFCLACVHTGWVCLILHKSPAFSYPPKVDIWPPSRRQPNSTLEIKHLHTLTFILNDRIRIPTCFVWSKKMQGLKFHLNIYKNPRLSQSRFIHIKTKSEF